MSRPSPLTRALDRARRRRTLLVTDPGQAWDLLTLHACRTRPEPAPALPRAAGSVLPPAGAGHGDRRLGFRPAFGPYVVHRRAPALVAAAERVATGWRDGAPHDRVAELAAAVRLGAGGPAPDQAPDQVPDVGTAPTGHEITARVVDRALAALAAEPRARAALAGELDRVLLGPGGRARAPRPDDPLPYVEAVIAETLRLWPPVRLVTRRVTGAFELGGRRFAPGWTCVVSIDVLHRDPRWWPDPERFLPERWLAPDEDGAGFDADGDRPRGAYLPFGAGPRRCAGELMGRQHTALVLAAVAGHRRAGRP